MTLTRVLADEEDLAARAAELFAEAIGAALRERGRAVVVLAGGATPRAAYQRLAKDLRRARVPLERIEWLPGDERWVPIASRESNEGMLRRALIGPAGAPGQTLRSWHPGEGTPAECAARFADRLASGPTAAGADLAILGIGTDGHTASLFPGAVALLPGGREAPVDSELPADAVAVLAAVPPGRGVRLTLTAKWLRRARRVVFLAAGSAKREALERTVRGDPSVPASWVRGTLDTLFLVDRAAAGPGPDATGKDVRHA